MYPNIKDPALCEFIRAAENLHGTIPSDQTFLLRKLDAAYGEIAQLKEENEKLKKYIGNDVDIDIALGNYETFNTIEDFLSSLDP